jgi:hypothetical protein
MKPIPTIAVAVLVIAGAVVHGATTRRWQALSPDAERAARVHAVVVRYADTESAEMPNDVPLKEASIATSRRYSSAAGGFAASTAIISGPPGAVATHTPDVCYSGNGYSTLRGPSRQTIDLPGGGQATYLVADFERKRETSVERYRVRWAWSTAGRWDAPDRARLAYMSEAELFKLYVVSPLPIEGTPADDSPAVSAFVAAAFAAHAAELAR